MGKNPTQKAKNLLISPVRKIPLIDLNLSLSKVSFFPIKQQFSNDHPMRSSFVAAVISVLSYFKFQALSTHMPC